MDDLLDRLSQSVNASRNVEDLTRPLLEMLEAVTGLESTYLTTVDLDAGVQRIVYARNTGQMQIPEGLAVPWHDTLCKRALDEGRMFTSDVSDCWGDSAAAAALCIQTYVSAPVRTQGGALYGTLCAASASRHQLTDRARQALLLFAGLIGHQVERELLVQRLLQANARLTACATTDPLTDLPNRRALMDTLQRLLAQGARQGFTVLVGFLDIDGFKAINDTHGHTTGDQFLVNIAQRLLQTLRTQDLAARIGGDEFVVIGPGPAPGDGVPAAEQAFAQRIAAATERRMDCNGVAIEHIGASVGVIAVPPGGLSADEALRQADGLMYQAKQARRAQRAERTRGG